MRIFRKNIVLYFCLAVLPFVTTCSGQTQQGATDKAFEESAGDSLPTHQPFIDPLFYIEGQLCAWVRNIFQDSKGQLWFGTNHYGVMRYDGDSLVYFSEKDGLGAGRITEILEDKEGNVWFGTYGGLTRYDGSTFTNFALHPDPMGYDIWSVWLDKNGTFWLGTSAGVYLFDGENFAPFPLPKIAVEDTTSLISYDRVATILEDRKGHFWFGTDGFGICRYDGEKFTHYTTADGLCDNNIAHLIEDSKGNIWIGTMFGGISRYDGKTFTNFTQAGAVAGVEVYGIYEAPDGSIWFSAEGHGVYRYDGKEFVNFDQDDGLNTGGIQRIYVDREGRHWLGGWGGLFRYNPSADPAFFSVTKEGPWH